jgi:hypothetical protein
MTRVALVTAAILALAAVTPSSHVERSSPGITIAGKAAR